MYEWRYEKVRLILLRHQGTKSVDNRDLLRTSYEPRGGGLKINSFSRSTVQHIYTNRKCTGGTVQYAATTLDCTIKAIARYTSENDSWFLFGVDKGKIRYPVIYFIY